MAFNVNQTAKVEFQERCYTFKAKRIVKDFKDFIMMFVIDEDNKSLAERMHKFYRPFIISVEITNSMTLTDNLAIIVESFLRHTLGMEQAEILED